jgi:hypothetical protein
MNVYSIRTNNGTSRMAQAPPTLEALKQYVDNMAPITGGATSIRDYAHCTIQVKYHFSRAYVSCSTPF